METKHKFRVGQKVRCVSIPEDRDEKRWFTYDKVKLGDILTVASVDDLGVRFKGKELIQDPEYFEPTSETPSLWKSLFKKIVASFAGCGE